MEAWNRDTLQASEGARPADTFMSEAPRDRETITLGCFKPT